MCVCVCVYVCVCVCVCMYVFECGNTWLVIACKNFKSPVKYNF